MRRTYHILDVFTDTPYAGNPLAVVLDSQGLRPPQMQAIAREFNLSETVFLFDPHNPVNTARARIFTPRAELPFAGHPTVGAAALIGKLRAPEFLGREDILVVIEEEIGTIVCNVRGGKGQPLRASFEIPRLPAHLGDLENTVAIAAALSIRPEDIGFESHRASLWSAGNPTAFIPLATRDAIARARPNGDLFEAAFGAGALGAFLYTSQCERATSDVHARFFAPAYGIDEDPATGSAAAAFAGVATAFERPEDGQHSIVIEQGFEMGRPSIIHLGVEIGAGELVAATVGGAVTPIAEGTLNA